MSEVDHPVGRECGWGDLVSYGSFESPVIPVGTWTTSIDERSAACVN